MYLSACQCSSFCVGLCFVRFRDLVSFGLLKLSLNCIQRQGALPIKKVEGAWHITCNAWLKSCEVHDGNAVVENADTDNAEQAEFVINEERGITGRQKVVRGSNVPVLTSHAGLNPRSKSGNEREALVINTNTGKFHKPDCKSVKKMKAKNKEEFNGSRDELIAEGYEPCGSCRP